MEEYKIIKDNSDYPKEIMKHLKDVNLELFKQSDEEVEILKGVDYKTSNEHPRVMYEMANIRMGEVAFFDDFEYDYDELYTFMTPSEQKAYDSLPPIFKAYRGYTSHSIDIERAYMAQSWTVDKKVAESFIEVHKWKYENNKSESVLFERLVLKSEVLLVLLGRAEAEIVLAM